VRWTSHVVFGRLLINFRDSYVWYTIFYVKKRIVSKFGVGSNVIARFRGAAFVHGQK
jgi:hypothetical protein